MPRLIAMLLSTAVAASSTNAAPAGAKDPEPPTAPRPPVASKRPPDWPHRGPWPPIPPPEKWEKKLGPRELPFDTPKLDKDRELELPRKRTCPSVLSVSATPGASATVTIAAEVDPVVPPQQSPLLVSYTIRALGADSDLLSGSLAFAGCGTAGCSASTLWSATAGPVPFGGYVATVSAEHLGAYPWERPCPIQDRQQALFAADAPPGCFVFDSGNDTLGWIADGFHDGNRPTSVGACSLQEAFWFDGQNWPFDSGIDGRGVIFVPVASCAFAADPAESGFVRVDFVSPALEDRPSFQGITGIEYRLLTNLSGLFAQSMASVRQADGSLALIQEIDDGGAAVLHPLDVPGWNVLSTPLPLPPGSTVLGLLVRIFLPADTLVEADSVMLDGVCPLR